MGVCRNGTKLPYVSFLLKWSCLGFFGGLPTFDTHTHTHTHIHVPISNFQSRPVSHFCCIVRFMSLHNGPKNPWSSIGRHNGRMTKRCGTQMMNRQSRWTKRIMLQVWPQDIGKSPFSIGNTSSFTVDYPASHVSSGSKFMNLPIFFGPGGLPQSLDLQQKLWESVKAVWILGDVWLDASPSRGTQALKIEETNSFPEKGPSKKKEMKSFDATINF